ncbi:PEP-CTERM sorting domain-containing protein [Rubripirellula amarantea]|nr:PEP-CTERM sorting domain-containing protein [Rubripirellula amarantea]
MKYIFQMCLLTVATLGIGSSASADLIVEFENDELATNSTFANTDIVHGNVSSSTLTSSGLNNNAGWPDALVGIQNNAGINSLDAAITNNHYFSFTVTPDANASVSYSDMFVRYSLGANTFPATTEFSLLTSITGFSSANLVDSFSGTASVSGLNVGTGTLDLSAATALQSVAVGSAAEFRIYVHNTGANAMTRIGIGQAFATNGSADLTLNGTVNVVAVPEPSGLAVLGCVGLAGLCIRRRRAKTAIGVN